MQMSSAITQNLISNDILENKFDAVAAAAMIEPSIKW